MKKEMTNIEIQNILNEIQEALKLDGKIVLPAKLSYKILKCKLALEQAVKAYSVTYDEVINARSNGKGQINREDDPKLFEEVTKELNSIAIEKNEIDVPTITIAEIGDRELPFDLIQAIEFMIVDEDSN